MIALNRTNDSRAQSRSATGLEPAPLALTRETPTISIRELLSLLWLFALLNYLYADVTGLWDIIGRPNFHVHFPPWVLMSSSVLMEIPMAMIVASRLLPRSVNRPANIVFGIIVTVVNGFLTYVPPLAGWGATPALPEYLFFATIETVCTLVIIRQAWTWRAAEKTQKEA